MYPDADEVSDHGLIMTLAAIVRAEGADHCEFCAAPPISPTATYAEKLAWARVHHAEQVAGLTRDPLTDGSHPWYEGDTDNMLLKRLAWDSRLQAVMGIPEVLLPIVAPKMDEDQRDFVQERFVFAMCDHCKQHTLGRVEPVAALLARYVDVFFEGSSGIAERQPSWGIVGSLAALIEDAARAAG